MLLYNLYLSFCNSCNMNQYKFSSAYVYLLLNMKINIDKDLIIFINIFNHKYMNCWHFFLLL